MQASASPVSTRNRPSISKVWMRAVRLFSFTASVTPVLIGSAFAFVDRSFSVVLFPMILVACVLCHAGCNLANDYFDYRKGIDAETTLGRGGVIQDGWLSEGQVGRGIVVALALATLIGIIICALSSWWVLAIAIPAVLAAVLYTGGPKPLGYVALGELTVWLFMGMGIVCGTYFAMVERLTWGVAIGSFGLSALVAAILHANNLRDFETDRVAGKTTLAWILGWSRAETEFRVLIVSAYAFVAILILVWIQNWPVALVAVTIPLARRAMRLTAEKDDPVQLNLSVRTTAQLHFRFGLLFAVGLLIRGTIDRIA